MCEYITNNGSDPTNYKPTKKMKTTENATSKAAQPDPVLAFEVFMSMHFEDLEDLEDSNNKIPIIYHNSLIQPGKVNYVQ